MVEAVADAPETVYVSVVKYIDYEKEWIPEENRFYPFVHKQKSFEHEREIRAMVFKIPEARSEDGQISDESPPGIRVRVNLTQLITAVYVAPDSAEWFKSLVESVVRNRYGLDVPVVMSRLADDPVY